MNSIKIYLQNPNLNKLDDKQRKIEKKNMNLDAIRIAFFFSVFSRIVENKNRLKLNNKLCFKFNWFFLDISFFLFSFEWKRREHKELGQNRRKENFKENRFAYSNKD